jgi:negative regulator of sigma E activity
MKLTSLVLILAAPVFAWDAAAIPGASEVIAKMMEHDAERQAAQSGYTAMRRYALENKNRRASMLVRVTVMPDGSKQFSVVEETGSGSIRKHVFHRILDEEADASGPKLRKESRIIPENYSFQIVGLDTVNDRSAYVIEVVPKTQNKYLIAGKIWVDAEEYAVMRVEGRPAKNPSFWIRSVQFVHTYGKNGSFWFPVSNRSVTDARIFGKAEMTIEYFDYLPNPSVLSASQSERVQP